MASEDLFSGAYLDTVLASASERLPEEVEQAPEEHLLHVDKEAWIAALVERRRLDPPALGESWMDPPVEVQIEGDLRQVLLVALKPSYPGQVTAETFNFTGKTDILVRHDDRNIFIAECKIWSGAKGFAEAIDQLFN
jgi:hypothetical protein